MPVTKRDYYEILGVKKTASVEEIKRAYRQLAMQHHPDRVPAEQKKAAEERFKEISEAYAVLTDAQKRAAYDQYGHAGFDQRYSTEDIFRNADFSSIFEGLGAGGSIFEDLLGAFGGSGRPRERRGADLLMELPVTFEEAVKGVTKAVTVPRHDPCRECQGKGGERTTCSACQGKGQVRQSAGFMVMVRPCSRCGGEGSQLKKACPACRGEGRLAVERKIQVKVPPGVEDGMRLRLAGEGELGARGHGDLYVQLTVAAHPLFTREGPHLLLEYPISFTQAALGAEVDVPTTNGRVSMKIPAGTQSHTVFRLRGKGLPDVRDGGTGDLLVRIVVETPTALTREQRSAMEALGRVLGDGAQPMHRSFVAKLKELWKKR